MGVLVLWNVEENLRIGLLVENVLEMVAFKANKVLIA